MKPFMIPEVIEAKEKRNVKVIDIPNAFIQTQHPKNEKVIMCLR